MRAERVRWALIAAGAALAAGILLTFHRVPRPRSRPVPTPAPPGAPPDAGKPTTLLSVFDYTETAAGRPKFRIHADRTVGFAQGAGLPSTWYGLEKVALTLYPENQPPVTAVSDRADFDPRTNAAHLNGHVVLSDPAGTTVKTARLEFDPAADTVRIPGEIAFLRGGMAGRASSGIYDFAARELRLAGPVTAQGEPGARAPFSTLESRTAVYRQTASEIEFGGGVHGQGGGHTLASERLTVHLAPDNRIDGAVASGGVAGELAPPRDPSRRDSYSGSEARLSFDAFGKPARADLLGAPGSPAVLVEPPAGEKGLRRVTAPRLIVSLSAGAVTAAHGEGGVRVEAPGPGAPGAAASQSVDSDTADASFSPDGLISAVTFAGHVRGVSPQGRGSAPRAVYSPAQNRTVLTSTRSEEAELLSPRGRLLGQAIEIDDAHSVVTASGQARAFLRGGPSGEAAPRFLTDPKQPTRARAERIVLDDRTRTADLTGRAALWQNDNALFAEEIFLNDADRSATAKGSVRVTASPAEDASPAKRSGRVEPGAGRVTATCGRLRYEEGSRTALLEEGVHLTRGKARGAGERAEMHFDEADRVDRLVLEGDVTFEDPPTGRSGQGDRAVDEPQKGVTVLTGDPAVARDGQGGRVTGAILTFRKESGSVEAKAKDGQKIETIYQTHGS